MFARLGLRPTCCGLRVAAIVGHVLFRNALPLTVLVAGMLSASSASAQFSVVDETSETKWGATAYAGGDVDTLGNYQFGIRVNYRLIQVKPSQLFIGFCEQKNRK